MKKIFYLLLIIVCLEFCVTVFSPCVFAALDINVTKPTPSDPSVDVGANIKLQTVGKKIWSIVRTVLRYAAIGTFIYAGVRYMIASADQKADLKKSMVPLVIGTLIVFGGTFVVEFIIKLFKDVAGIP